MKPRLILLLTVLFLLPAVLAQTPVDPRLAAARDAFADRDYARGVTLFREVLDADPSGTVADESAMMIVRGLSLAGDHAEAAREGEDFLARFPGSRFLDKVAHLTARSLLRLGRGAEADELLSATLSRLQAPAARARIAAYYLSAADRAFDGVASAGPFDPGTPPDFSRALRLYGLARETGVPAKLRPAVLLRTARAAVETNGYDLAIGVLDELDRATPETDPRAEALLLRGRAWLGRKVRPAAADALERLVALHPASEEAPEALLLLDDPAHLERLVREYPDHEHAARASHRAGEILAADGRVDLAVAAFDRTVQRFPAAPAAQASALAAADALFGAGRYEEAQSRYDAFLRRWPESASWAKARDQLTEAWYRRGKVLLDGKQIDAAAEVWAALRATYPLSPHAPETLLLEGRHRSGEAALALFRELIARHPKSAEAPAAALRIAGILGKGKGKVAELVAALNRVIELYPGSGEANEARRTLTEMQRERLDISLPEPLRPDQAPALRLATRNIERVSARAWRIDPVQYFEKHGTLGGVHDVMVEVVKPDVSFEKEVGGYERFREIDGALAVPVTGPGAWIVVVEGGKLRAAGLLLVSGLTVITKESPAGVLAFVQRAGGGEPVEGAEVLVRDGGGKVRRATTGSDGVAKLDFPNRAGGVSVLATEAGSVAYAGYDGVRRNVTGLESKVHVSTDRSLYRPGDEVSWRIVARRSSGERHETPSGAAYVVSVTDKAGNSLTRKSGLLSEFGTADGAFRVPSDAPPGTYRILVRFDERDFGANVVVEAYRKPQVFLGVEPLKSGYLRGDEVQFAVTARYAFGRPMPDLAIAVDARQRVGGSIVGSIDRIVRTDADGRAILTVPTVPGPDMEIAVRAEAADATGRMYVAAGVIRVPAAGYAATLEASRDRVFPGEPVRLTLLTTDADGNPVAATGRIEVARGVGGRGFADEDRLPAETGDDGVAEIVWTAGRTGTYRLRWVGADRRGTEVTAVVNVSVLSERDDRLLVRAEHGRYRVGDEAKIDVFAGGPGWALLTCEGEEVYSHRVVRLVAGRNAVALAVTADLFPDVHVRVTAPGGERHRMGGDRITVDQEIRVVLEPEKTEYGPGETCRLTVKTADLAGRPVPAEVALAVVDEGIFRLREDDTPSIVATFRPPERQDLVRTESSFSFHMSGVTTGISEDLLAERERRTKPDAKAEVLLEEKSLDALSDAPFDGPATNAAIGIGGGAGGAFGGRGGHRNLRAQGGGAMAEGLFEPRADFKDTAYWRAAVITGADGTATVEFKLPDDMTEWRLTARAASRGNAFGEGLSAVRTARPLVIRAALPRFLREGDELVAAAGVVNGTGAAITADVVLSPSADGETRERLEIPADREMAVAWPLGRAALGTTKYTARVGTPTLAEDAEVRPLRTIPYGVPYRTGFAGASTEPGEWRVVLPADRVPGTERLTLTVAPSLMRAALDGVAELRRFPYGCTEQTVNRFYPALEVATAIRALGLDLADALPELDRIAREGALRLTYLQNKEGLWGWWTRGGTNAEMTAYALIGLARAKATGVEFSPDTLVRAAAALPGLIARTKNQDERAFLHFAASTAFGVDFERLAPAFADRARLGASGLAWLALAYDPVGVTSQRTVLLGMLRDRIDADGAPDLETAGWVLAAIAGADPASAYARRFASGLVSRRGGAFATTRETGAVVVGLCRVAAGAGMAAPDTQAIVTVNGAEVLRQRLGNGPLAGRTFDVPADRLAAGDNRITVTGTGGTFHHALTLTCVRRETPAAAGPYSLSRTLTLVPDADPFGARTRASIVRKGTVATESPVEVVRVGEVVRVTIRLARRSSERYLVVEEPLAAGFEPIPGSEKGPFSEAIRHDDRFVFFLENPPEEAEITFLARSESPGRVRIPPGIAYAMYRPESAAWSRGAGLTVVGRGDALDRDPTLGLSAADLLDQARRLATGREWEAATGFLEALFGRFELTDPAKTEALRLLATVRLAAGDAAGAVDAYERLRAELPGAGRELDDHLVLARAWRRLDRPGDAVSETESAIGILFERDARVPAEIGAAELPDYVPALLDAYPFGVYAEAADLEYVNRMTTAYEADVRAGKEPDPAALDAARRFLAEYPESGAAPDVAFRFARMHLRAGRYEALEAEARRFSDRYPEHPLGADADWFVAFSLFAQGRYDEAEATAVASLARTYPLPSGETGPSPYVSNLIHLRAQVAHVAGRLDEAVALYEQVAEKSVDAREALRLLTERVFTVAPVTRVSPGEKAAVVVTGKNVASARVDLYPVDLLVYFALVKDVARVSGLNLDGLAPAATKDVALGGGRRETEIRVGLGVLDPGVYLVIGRADGTEERGVLLVSDLAARIHRYPEGVRVVVTDRASGAPVPGAYVKLAADGEIVGEGATDPRGYFEVRGDLEGGLAAVARKEARAALATE